VNPGDDFHDGPTSDEGAMNAGGERPPVTNADAVDPAAPVPGAVSSPAASADAVNPLAPLAASSPPPAKVDPVLPYAAQPSASRGRRFAVTALKVTLFAIVLALVIPRLWHNLREVNLRTTRLNPWFVLLCAVCAAGTPLVQLVVFRELLAAYFRRLPWRVMVVASFLPPLGKYLPGKVAALGGTIYLLRRQGVPGAIAFSLALMQDGLAVITGMMVAAPLLLWEPIRRFSPLLRWLAPCVVVIGIICLHPRVFTGVANLALRLFRRPRLAARPTLRQYMLPMLITFGQWVCIGLALWCMARAVTPVAISRIPLFIASASFAMTLSYLALFAPGGLGPREALLLVTLSPLIGAESAAIVVVAIRVVQTLIELTLAALGYLVLRRLAAQPAM
jgi:hypothetical protein